jgi:uncharacterized membrane protein YecN with MAPEG domain
MVITPFYAGLLAMIFLVLSWRVIQYRQRGFPLGDGGDPKLLRLIRGHANFAEYVPLVLLMIGFLEIAHTSTYILHALGIVLVGSRLLHGYALSFTERFQFGRVWGTGLTFAVLGVSGVLCLLQGLKGMSVT